MCSVKFKIFISKQRLFDEFVTDDGNYKRINVFTPICGEV